MTIKELIEDFFSKHLNKECEDYALKLLEDLENNDTFNLNRGKKEIWASSIVYLIADLNLLFDKSSEHHITQNQICSFFRTIKATVSGKAAKIEKEIDPDDYCSDDIIEDPSDDLEVVFEIADEETSSLINQWEENRKRMKEQKLEEQRARRAAMAEAKKKEREANDPQMKLFDGF